MKDIVEKKVNKKGQALVEFVLLLPIIFLIIFIIIDFANVYYSKNHLEGVMNDVVILAKDKVSTNTINEVINDPNIKYQIKIEGKYAYVTLSEDIYLTTPFSSILIKNPFSISTKRVIIYE